MNEKEVQKDMVGGALELETPESMEERTREVSRQRDPEKRKENQREQRTRETQR